MNNVFGKYCTPFHGCLVVANLQRIKNLVSVCVSEPSYDRLSGQCVE